MLTLDSAAGRWLLLAAAGVLLMLRIGPGASYAGDVLPAVIVFGLGLVVMVSPLTATALAAAPPEHAGMASGVNNAVARTAGLAAVAAVPVLAGLDGRVYDDPVAFDTGFATAVLVSAAVLVAGGLLAALTVRDDVLLDSSDDQPGDRPDEQPDEQPDDGDVRQLRHCAGVGGPPLATRVDAAGHAHLTGHAVVRSFEPDEGWFYCYLDDVAMEVPDAPPAPSHP